MSMSLYEILTKNRIENSVLLYDIFFKSRIENNVSYRTYDERFLRRSKSVVCRIMKQCLLSHNPQ